MLASAHSVLCFDAFSLDPVRCVLLRGSSELSLRRQSFEVLRYLAEHGLKIEIVDRDRLVELEPSLAQADVAGGVYSPMDQTGDSRLFVERLAARAARIGDPQAVDREVRRAHLVSLDQLE